MQFELEFLGYTAVAPCVTAFVAAVLFRRIAPRAVPLAAAVGCVIGYVLLPDWAPLSPDRHWQWIHYLTPLAATLGILAAMVPAIGRVVLWAVLGGLFAYCIVPDWDTLQPSRPILIAAVALNIVALSLLLDALPVHLRGRLFLVQLTCVAAAVALLVGVEVSLKLGHAAAAAISAFAGCAAWSLFEKNSSVLEFAARGFIPVFAAVAIGFAFVGAVEPTQPVWILLLAPAAPLLLWAFARGPLARLQGPTAAVLQTSVIALVPLAILIWLLLAAKPEDDWNARTGPRFRPAVPRVIMTACGLNRIKRSNY